MCSMKFPAKASLDCLKVLPVFLHMLNCRLIPVALLQGMEGRHPLSRQQQPAKVAPVEQGGRSEGEGGSQARGPTPAAATPSMEQPMHQKQSGVRLSNQGMVSIVSEAKLTTVPAVADDSEVTQPSVTAAAAAAAASAQLSQMQARVAALERDKDQLSTQLSAAHSCIELLRDAEALSKEIAIIPDKTAEEDQEQLCQLAREVTKVGFTHSITQ